jgi:hypothetical protein
MYMLFPTLGARLNVDEIFYDYNEGEMENTFSRKIVHHFIPLSRGRH